MVLQKVRNILGEVVTKIQSLQGQKVDECSNLDLSPKIAKFWHQKVFEGIASSFGNFIFADSIMKAWSWLIDVRFYVMVEFGVMLPNTITLESELGD